MPLSLPDLATMTSSLVEISYAKIGMKINFVLGTMTAFDITIEMKHKSFYSNPFSALSNILVNIEDDSDNCFHSTHIYWNLSMNSSHFFCGLNDRRSTLAMNVGLRRRARSFVETRWKVANTAN
jgi:hypothetical protein